MTLTLTMAIAKPEPEPTLTLTIANLKSVFPSHCDIYARVEIKTRLTMLDVNARNRLIPLFNQH